MQSKISQLTRWGRWLSLVVVLVLGVAAGGRAQAAGIPTIGIGAPDAVAVDQDVLFRATLERDVAPEFTAAAPLAGFEFTWRFSDGVSATGRVFARTFTRPGVYTVTLVVRDGDGDSASLSRTVIVTEVLAPDTESVSLDDIASVRPDDTKAVRLVPGDRLDLVPAASPTVGVVRLAPDTASGAAQPTVPPTTPTVTP